MECLHDRAAWTRLRAGTASSALPNEMAHWRTPAFGCGMSTSGVHERPLCQALNSCQPEGEGCSRTFGLWVQVLAAVPDGICWLAPRSLTRTLGAPLSTGLVNHGLTCLAITSLSPEQSVVFLPEVVVWTVAARLAFGHKTSAAFLHPISYALFCFKKQTHPK